MKKLFIILTTLLCAVGTASAIADWVPSEQYCRFCNNFKFDHAFTFSSPGGEDNGSIYSPGVDFQECQGVIAFSVMSWDRFNAVGKNYGMTWLEVYLTASGQNDMYLTDIHFTDPGRAGSWANSYKESNFIQAYDMNGCKTYFLQKRQFKEHDRCQFSYFNIVYSDMVYDYIHNNKNNNLGLRLKVRWDSRSFDEKYTFGNEKDDILPRTSTPTLSNFQWTKNNEGKTVLRFTASDIHNSIYYERAVGDAASGSEKMLTSSSGVENRERNDVANLTRDQLNRMAQDNASYAIEVSRRANTYISKSYYNNDHGGPASPFAGPQSDWKKVYVPALFLPENVQLSHTGGDSIYVAFDIPRKPHDRDEDESAIVIEYSTDENFGSYETERVDFNTSNRLVKTSYKVGLPIPMKMLNQGRKTFYVRLSREFVDHKTTCVKEDILINTNLRKLSGVNAHDEGGKIKVSWTHEGDDEGVWTSDMFYRVQYVVSGTTYSQDYPNRNLTSVELTDGIPTCLPIEYTVQICTDAKIISSRKSNLETMAPTRDAVITSLTATKGESNNRVRLQWTVPKDKNGFSYFTITRALRGDSVATTLVPQMPMNPALTTYTYEDNSMELGTYYNYTVTGFRDCDGSLSPMSSLTETGFALPYGVITGQITYDGRQGVPGVLVTAVTEDEIPVPKRLKMDTVQAQAAIYFRTLQPTGWNDIGGPKYTGTHGSVMFWFRRTGSFRDEWTDWTNLINLHQRIRIHLDTLGHVIVEANNCDIKSKPLSLNEWYHVAVTFTNDSVTLYLNGQVAGGMKFSFDRWASNGIGGRGSRGYEMADIRLYNYCMDSTEIKTTAVQIPLKGDETGLELYYSACEKGNEVHDLSGHSRHLETSRMSFGKTLVKDSIPQQIVFRMVDDSTRINYTTYTKSDGTYVITGVPYSDRGTYYKIIPTLGTHEFAPANRPLYFNHSSNTHNNVNFTDMTSVKVSGAIYYEGTDYPVEGALLSVDGVQCLVGGVPVLTNADGKFSILVPMGPHYITAAKAGHTFAYNGRYPEDPNNAGVTYEFLHDINDLRFYDNTKLLLVGRVAGGDEEQHKPHGMHLGKANIGRAVITLTASDIYSLNTDSVERVWPMPTDSIVAAGRVVTAASGTDLSHDVVIYTDSVTGEYTAFLPPLTYKVKSIVIPSNEDYRFNPLSYNPIELGDRAGQMLLQDTLRIDSTTVQRVRYHMAFDAPYYVEPVLTVTDAMRSDLAFGEEWLDYQDERGKLHMVPSFTVDSATGKPDYRMTYPLFRQGTSYRWRLKVTETYVNKDDAAHPVTTVLPWKNGIVTIKNEIGNRIAAERDTIVTKENDSTSMIPVKRGETLILGENQIALDSTGMGIYQFRATDPNISKPYTLGANMSYKNVYGTREYSWSENGKFYGVVLGSITNGSDILTNGPDDILYILRNAPGGASTVAATAGTTFTQNNTRSSAIKWGAMTNWQFGVGAAGAQGFLGPFVSVMFMEEAGSVSVNGTYLGNKAWAKSQVQANALTQTVSTTPGTEGAGGDVFVGQATNDVFSNSRRVDIRRDPTDSTRYYIGDFDGYVYGKRFGTQFVYTQNHIENKVMPDFIRQRNALLQYIDKATFDRYKVQYDTTAIVNTTDKLQYYTYLTPDKEGYGTDTTKYVLVPPKYPNDGQLHLEKDMVLYYNEQVRTWKQLLAHNEEMKVMCQQRNGAFKADQYDAAVLKVARLSEVKKALDDARKKMQSVNQYKIDSLRAFNKRTQYGEDKQYMGFSKGEVERLIKTYDDNAKIEKEQLAILDAEQLDTLRTNISDYYGGGYLMQNYSLSPGTSVVLSQTKSLSNGNNITTTHDATLTGGGGFGVKEIIKLVNSNNINLGRNWMFENGTRNDESFATNITLAMNATSSMSFDMYAAPDGFAPIFFVRGGATSCPYIDEERTKYFEPGRHVLTTSTAAIDKPYLYLRQGTPSMQNDLPVGASAYFTLGMTNQSSVTGSAGVYKLRPMDKHSGEQLGAVLEVNGTPLTSAGITYMVASGDSLFVQLRVYQSNPEVMKYDDIALELYSDCDPTRRSELHLSVSYRYSCSDINLTLDNTLLNTQTKSILGKDTVELSGEISGLLQNYSALYGVRLQYKRGEGEWSTLRTWRKGITVRDKEGNYPMPHAEHFRFAIPMPDKDYSDGTYQVRAVTVCRPAAEEEVCHESETFTVIKDVVRPEPISTPTPADGVLRNGNDISVTFTKDIQPARVLATNISVTGELNGHDLRHSVGLQLGGQKAATQATLRLGASDFTIETWLNYSEAGELMNIGGDKFRLSLTEDGKLAVQMDTTVITTTGSLPKNKWVFLALSYTRATTGNVLNASIAYDDVTTSLMPTPMPTPAINTKAALQLGGGSAIATLHDLTIWSVARSMVTSLSERSRSKVPSTPGLMAYWPMNEGYGPVAAEHVHARHIATRDNAWWIAGENYSAVLDGSNALRVPVSEVGIAAVDDYELDFWVNATSDGTILRNGDTTLVFAVKNGKLDLRIGNKSYIVNRPIVNNSWHFIALNVRRSGTTAVILDESIVYQFVDSYTTPRLGDYLTIGDGLKGAFDELHIARASYTNELLLLTSHFRLHGNETGLVAYYPFEKDSIDSGNQHMTVPTLEDRCKNALNKHSAQWVNSQFSNTNHPALVEARPVEPVPFSFTASDRQITIKLNDQQMAPARVEGCNLKVEIKNVVDEHGNYGAPVCWNLYVQRNSLLWEDSYASVTKNELDEQSFELTMVNTGSEMQSWQITNIPAWLQLNATSGVIRPQSELTLTATLPASLAAGYYADILLLTGNDGIAEPCLIEAAVLAPEPDWKVNVNTYAATGNIIAKLSLPAGVAQSEHDIIAAFVNSECIGIARPKYIDNYDAWYVMMTVYGDEENPAQTPIQFRLWNAESGITYSSVKVRPEPFQFLPNMVKGTLADPVVLEVTNYLQQTLALQPSWNWISLNVNPVSARTEIVFRPILGDISCVKDKNSVFTISNATTYGGTLKVMSVTSSYRVKANRANTLTIEGTAINCAQTPVSINKGWTWIGYLPLQTMSVSDALADIAPATGDLVKSKTAFAVYDGAQWVGTLTRMTPGEGYMYQSHATEGFTFRYPDVSALQYLRAPMRTNDPMVNVFTPVTDPYSGNMSIVARVMNGDEAVHGVEVGIFAGDECRGAATEEFSSVNTTDGYWFLTVAGDEAAPLTIKVYDPTTGETITVQQTLTYTDDATIGSLDEPYIIQLGVIEGVENIHNGTATDSGSRYAKIIENGILYILRDGEKYEVTGKKVPVAQ